jgi:hypothetical protein
LHRSLQNGNHSGRSGSVAATALPQVGQGEVGIEHLRRP